MKLLAWIKFVVKERRTRRITRARLAGLAR
jgi:hypothetical protein